MPKLTYKQQTQMIGELQAVIEKQQAIINKQQETIASQALQIKDLQATVKELLRRYFGKSSEQLDSNQLLLLMEGMDSSLPKPEPCAPPQEEKRKVKAKTPRKETGIEDLPVVEEIIDPLEVQAAPEQWRQIGEEVTVQVEYQRAKMYRKHIIRRRYVKKQEPSVVPVIAPLPPRLLEGSHLSASLLAHIIAEKFCYHIPFYRQEAKMLNEHGVRFHRQTFCRWAWHGANWLRLIYEEMERAAWQSGYVQVDESGVKYLEPGHGSTKIGYLWVLRQPLGDSVYRWFPSRAAECLETIIPKDYGGHIQTDGYAAYSCYGKEHPSITWAGCWTHMRRGFYEAQGEDLRRAGWVLRQIQHLYQIEEELRKSGPGANRRLAFRQAQSAPIVRRLGKMFEIWKDKKTFLPQSGMGKAINYALNQWPQLQVFLTDGRIEIDNNLVENAIRPTAIGKKNWLFFGSECSGQTAAILYTIIESCRRHRIDPESYLCYVFTILPGATTSQIKDLLPEAIAKSGMLPLVGKPSRQWGTPEPRVA